MTIETYTLTGYVVSPKTLAPEDGTLWVTPDQTIADGETNVVVAGLKFTVKIVAGIFVEDDGTPGVVMPTGIGYHGRIVFNSGYPPEADWTVPLGTVTLDWADITNVALSPLTPTGLALAEAYTDAAIAALALTVGDCIGGTP